MILINSEHSNFQFFCVWELIFTSNIEGTSSYKEWIDEIPYCAALYYKQNVSQFESRQKTEPIIFLKGAQSPYFEIF